METKIFDKETLLDLMVNFIPLGIILFFIAAFVVFAPWGFDPMASGLMLTIMGGMFVVLTVLTYVSAKAIAGDEKTKTVYAQGQAGLKGAVPLHGEADDEPEVGDGQPEPTAESDEETDAESDEEIPTAESDAPDDEPADETVDEPAEKEVGAAADETVDATDETPADSAATDDDVGDDTADESTTKRDDDS